MCTHTPSTHSKTPTPTTTVGWSVGWMTVRLDNMFEKCTVASAGDVHLVHGGQVVQPVQGGARLLVIARYQQVRLVWILRRA